MQIGAFKIESELGSGGMGTVWLATADIDAPPVTAGTQVAIKIIHPHLLARPGTRDRFLREAEVGRRVEHENVVRTLAVGAEETVDGPVEFLVMEYVEGRTLATLVEELGTVPEALIREIAGQIAAGLQAIHESGVVHRDLKPENVLVTGDHIVRIMDLGVARLLDGDADITAQGEFSGSLRYAAPEQFRDEPVGPQMDLYALGILFHELATGENPFRRGSAAETIAAHLDFHPPPVSDRNPEISPFFTHLIASLLDKNPGHRLFSAGFLREVLDAGEGSRWWREERRILVRERAKLPSTRIRRETRIFGRNEEIEGLRADWSETKNHHGRIVRIEGEPGIGKTRLVDAFLETLEHEDVHVLYGSYPPSGGLGAISDAILEHFGPEGLEDALRPYLTETPSLVASFAAHARHQTPSPDLPTVAGGTLESLLCQLMQAMAAERPLIWIVEDLHFASEDSRRLVVALARAVEDRRVLLALTSREHRPGGALAPLADLDNFRRIELDRLGARDVIELLRDAFQSERLAEKLGGKIAYKSDGVPFFVLEMVRGLRSNRQIRRRSDGEWVETDVIEHIEVPSAVRDLVAARLRGLSDEDRNLLDLAAVQGFEFDPGLLALIRGLSRMVILERLAAIERSTGAVRGAGRLYHFDHHQLQEVLYSDLHESLRAEYHTALAEALSERERVAAHGPDDLSGETAGFLAHHYLRGNRPEMGLPYVSTALGHLSLSYRNDQALDIADRALGIEGLLRGRERAEILMSKADRLALLARGDEEGAALEEAATLLDADGDACLRARVRNCLGFHLHRAARYEDARRHLESAFDLALEGGDPVQEVLALRGLGTVLWALGKHGEAQRFRQRALDLAREIGDRGAEAKALGNLGNLCWYLDRYREAQEYYELELEIARETGDRRDEGLALGSLGLVTAVFGKYEKACRLYEQSLAIAREIGDRQGEAAVIGNLGNALLKLGRLTETVECRRRHLRIAQEGGAPHARGIALINLGSILSSLGDPRGAEERHVSARKILTEIGALRSLADLEICRAELALWSGSLEAAQRHLDAALDLSHRAAHRRGTAQSKLLLGRLRAERSKPQEAIRDLREARDEARSLRRPRTTVLATAHLARLGAVSAEDALVSYDADRLRLGVEDRMECRFLLWEVTGDGAHLECARRHLAALRDHAPTEFRETMIDHVPLHRAIASARG